MSPYEKDTTLNSSLFVVAGPVDWSAGLAAAAYLVGEHPRIAALSAEVAIDVMQHLSRLQSLPKAWADEFSRSVLNIGRIDACS